MTRITLNFPDEHLEKLQQIASRLNVAPEELLRISVEELITHPDEAFQHAAEHVLRKNADLFRRMA
jgi:predicted transcriptional regulator